MDKVSKFLVRLTPKDRERLMPIIRDIMHNLLAGLDCRKLRGRDAEYRVRAGDFRIQFVRMSHINMITKIGFRGDNTY